MKNVDDRIRRLYCAMENRNQREYVLLSRRLAQLDGSAVSSLERHLAEMELVTDRLKVRVVLAMTQTLALCLILPLCLIPTFTWGQCTMTYASM